MSPRIKERKCVSCEMVKKNAEFRRGLPTCKQCEADPNVVIKKECKECMLSKPESDFRKNRKLCIDCERAHGRQYRRTTTKAKEWAETNKEKMTELQSKWYQENKQYIHDKEKKRMEDDVVFKEIKKYRISICSFISGGTLPHDQLNITRDEYFEWLKYCFTGDMSLENRKSWEIDHVVPLDILNDKSTCQYLDIVKNTPNYKELLFCWYNTQPLTRIDNRLKSNNINSVIVKEHLTRVCNYMKDKDKDDLYKSYVKLLMDLLDAMKN
jgi:hypothetical protein